MKPRIVTIEACGNNLWACDEDGHCVARRSTTCNPAALRQLILDVEMAACLIDWANSSVAKPEEVVA